MMWWSLTFNPLNAKDVCIRPCTRNSGTKDGYIRPLRSSFSGKISLVVEKGMGCSVKSADPKIGLTDISC